MASWLMANRAYLFATDGTEPKWGWPLSDAPDREFYDSRWSVPVAWFLFFAPGDVLLKDAAHRSDHWREVYLLGDRRLGIARFEQRRRVLSGRFPLGEVDYESFLADISSWSGRNLAVDLREIGPEGENDEMQAACFAKALRALDRMDGDAFFDGLKHYLGEFPSADAERLAISAIGCAYRRPAKTAAKSQG